MGPVHADVSRDGLYAEVSAPVNWQNDTGTDALQSLHSSTVRQGNSNGHVSLRCLSDELYH